MMRERVVYPRALRVARQVRAHDLRAAVRVRRRVPRGRRGAVGARPALDHGRDGRRTLARDGAEPADRRRPRRAQPAHGRPRASRRAAVARWRSSPSASVSLAVFLVAVFQLDPLVHWLWPIPVAGFVIYPYLKRWTWLCHLWLGAVDGLAPVGAWAAITGTLPWQSWVLGGAVALWVAGFDLFYALLDHRDRPRAGAAVGRGALRRARRVLGRAALPPRDGCAARRGGARPRRRPSSTGWASPRLRGCSRTSIRSSARATCGGSTPRSSP